VDVALGVVIVLAGVGLASSGLLRLVRPRRQTDVEWIRRYPLFNTTLGGFVLGFDRNGALVSLAAGIFAILLGIALLVLS
jgi:hypothetical protein